jgi:hypothetical protein
MKFYMENHQMNQFGHPHQENDMAHDHAHGPSMFNNLDLSTTTHQKVAPFTHAK